MAKTIDWDTKRETWLTLVNSLVSDIATWAEEQGWPVHRDEKQLKEEHLGQYSVPDLVIRLPGGRIIVEVVGRNIIGAEGRVDIEAFPSMNRMLLVRQGDKWKVKTDARVDWPRPWSKKTFLELAKVLTAQE